MTRITAAQAARIMNVSVRGVYRAGRVLRLGVPELVELIERGQLRLGAAELIAGLPHDLQRDAIAHGPKFLRQLAAELRRIA